MKIATGYSICLQGIRYQLTVDKRAQQEEHAPYKQENATAQYQRKFDIPTVAFYENIIRELLFQNKPIEN